MTWALSAHNNVETHHGYSPTHLLFGLGSGKNSVEDMGLVDNLGEEDDLRYANLLKHRLESRLNHHIIKANKS